MNPYDILEQVPDNVLHTERAPGFPPRYVDGAAWGSHAQEEQPLVELASHQRVLQFEESEEGFSNKKSTFKPTLRYVDKNGKTRWKGKQLTDTGLLCGI